MPTMDIETIVIVMMENRSFDHMLGYLSLADAGPPMPVEGLRDDPVWRGGFTNLYLGDPYPIHILDGAVQNIDDPPHEQATIALQINTPPYPGSPDRMGGFVQSYMKRDPLPTDRSLVMGCYRKEAVPVFDFFARNFTICDHWFAALPTGTQANRLMAMSGTSSIVDNAPVLLPDQDLVYDWLSEHKVPWCAYQAGDFFPFFTLMARWSSKIVSSLTLAALGVRDSFRRYRNFRDHWLAPDVMPNVIFIEPEYTDGPHGEPNDDHPPTGIAKGQAFLADIYSTLISNPARWAKTMLIVTYDEHGGFFDHVPPLPIPTTVAGFPFKTTGVRVPAFIVSPQVMAGQVFQRPLDHTSILQLLADRFNPGADYSASVGARQPQLSRLSELLRLPAQPARAPAIPPTTLQVIQAAAAAAPPPPARGGGAAGATANATAFHNMAVQVAQAHPDLMQHKSWASLKEYIDQFG